MFFILSKTLAVLIRPINWVAFFLLVALFSKRPKRKRRSLILAVACFFFFNNHFIFNQVIRWWEDETITADEIQAPYDIGILLGGYSNPYIFPSTDRHNFSDRANRFTNALELYYEGKIRKILLTGGSGSLLQNVASEAMQMKQFLLKIGIPESDILVEANSRNTHENALFSKQLLEKEFPEAKLLLITSAWHMPRAKRCFQKVGIHATPYSADFFSEGTRFAPESWLFPYRQGFIRWEYLIKEWVGIVIYKLKGYI